MSEGELMKHLEDMYKHEGMVWEFMQEEDEVLVLRADLIQRKEVDSNYYETFNDYSLRA